MYTLYGAWAMANMDRVDFWMPPPAGVPWQPVHYLLTFAMWVVMMAAMMAPGVAPTVFLFAAMRRGRSGARLYLDSSAFVAGYLVSWAAFSAAATLVQWSLHQAALLTPMMHGTSTAFAAVLLAGAGVYQWTPLKDRCLAQCRSPFGFLLSCWRDGPGGALWMGIRHGLFCVGCCWALMALLFALGVMDVRWVAALTVFVLLEKLVPAGRALARIAGAGFLLWAAWLAAAVLAG
ncbi:MAG: DUF2182 domain-containing protein [Gammaproteobacteria bacterium]|nr:DUF2182 domain-containing protein [Gammaproteobacteria bacterium]